MALKIITHAAVEPITLAQAKLHCRVDNLYGTSAHPDDDLITALIVAARQTVEHESGRKLAADQTWEMSCDAFPDVSYIDLEASPVTSITSVKYTDGNGAEQTFAGANYALSAYGFSSRLNLTAGASWPATQSIPDAVRIRFVAGFSAADLPKPLRQAMLLLIAHWYANREAVVIGTISSDLPMAVQMLINGAGKRWSKR